MNSAKDHELALAEQAKFDRINGIEEQPRPRLVNLIQGQGYGFFLHDQDGHYLTQIAPGEPADLAGVKENDRIVEINGINVESATHSHVVDLIRKSDGKVRFLVVDKKTDKYYKSRHIRVTSDLMRIELLTTSTDL